MLLATAFAFCPANASKSLVMNRFSPHDPSPQPPATEAAPGPIDSSGTFPSDTPNPYAAPLAVDPLPAKKQDENRPAGEIFSPCLRCGCKHAQRIKSWWRYLLEPLLTTHVQCLACGARYNGKRGIWNTIGLLLNWLIVIITVLMLQLIDWYPAVRPPRPPRAPAPAPPAATSSSSLRWFRGTLPGKRVRPALNSRRDLQELWDEPTISLRSAAAVATARRAPTRLDESARASPGSGPQSLLGTQRRRAADAAGTRMVAHADR